MKQVLCGMAISAALCAQGPKIVEEKQIRIMAAPGANGPGAGTFTWMSAETNFEATLVKGVPFTGDFVTENSQTLADGNRIRTTNSTGFARDSEGRTRREVTIDSIGPFAGGPARTTIFINDPVAKIDYILDPEAKTARKINVGLLMGKVAEAGAAGNAAFVTRSDRGASEPATFVFQRKVEEAKDVLVHRAEGGPAVAQAVPLPPGMVMQGHAGAVIGQRIMISDTAGPHPSASNLKREPLGTRMIDGVEAEGTRTTLTIPAGQIGNDRALETVSERWYSNELKTVVMTTRKDPRTGESVYKLTNLRRGEPARQLFEVPPEYKVIEDGPGGNVMRMRIDHKE